MFEAQTERGRHPLEGWQTDRVAASSGSKFENSLDLGTMSNCWDGFDFSSIPSAFRRTRLFRFLYTASVTVATAMGLKASAYEKKEGMLARARSNSVRSWSTGH